MTCITQLAFQGSPRSLRGQPLRGKPWSSRILTLTPTTFPISFPTTAQPRPQWSTPLSSQSLIHVNFHGPIPLHKLFPPTKMSFLLSLFHVKSSLCDQDPAEASHFLLSLLSPLPSRAALSCAHRAPWITSYLPTHLSHRIIRSIRVYHGLFLWHIQHPCCINKLDVAP